MQALSGAVNVAGVAQARRASRSAAAAAPRPAMGAAVMPARAAFGNVSCLAARAVAVKSSVATRSVTVMKGDAVSCGYAAALADTAQAAGSLETVHNDTETMLAYMKSNGGIASLFINPTISDKKKKEIISKISKEGSFTPIFTNFLNLLVDKRRSGSTMSICEEFDLLYCKLTDTQVATVTSATKLENEQQFQIAKKLQELTGAKNIKLKPEVDDALIGGFVVQFGKDGSGYIDMSVKGQLERLAATLQPTTA
jgi:F-type H+-transporting ATPase subunit delta